MAQDLEKDLATRAASLRVPLRGLHPHLYADPAHSMKRREIESEQDYQEIGIACLNCHRILDEKMNAETMRAEVLRVIRLRSSESIG